MVKRALIVALGTVGLFICGCKEEKKQPPAPPAAGSTEKQPERTTVRPGSTTQPSSTTRPSQQ